MSVKKLLILAAAAVASTSAVAGGASSYSAPSSSMAADNSVGLYVGADVGYAFNNWKNKLGGSWSRDSDWRMLGLDVGYQFDRNLGLELGGFMLPESKYTTASPSASFKSWVAYVAGTGTVHLIDSVDVIGKLGFAYEQTKVGAGAPSGFASTTAATEKSWFNPMFAAALSYNLTPEASVDAQWAHFVGTSKDGKVKTASPDVLSVGVKYMFAM